MRGSNAVAVIARLNPIIRGLGRLLPRGGVQQGVRRVGQLPVAADLAVGLPQPPQQAEEVDRSTLLRPVQQVQERSVGVR